MPSCLHTLQGADRITNLCWAISRRLGERAQYRLALVNGEAGLLRYVDGQLESAQAFVTDGERIVAIYTVRDPAKLAGGSSTWPPDVSSPRLSHAPRAPRLERQPLHFTEKPPWPAHAIRVNYPKLAPKAFKALYDLPMAVHDGALGPRLVELVQLRLSQINGCALCIDMHWAELVNAIPQRDAGDEEFAALKAHFSDTGIAALGFAIAAIKAWNLLNVSFRNPLPEKA